MGAKISTYVKNFVHLPIYLMKGAHDLLRSSSARVVRILYIWRHMSHVGLLVL